MNISNEKAAWRVSEIWENNFNIVDVSFEVTIGTNLLRLIFFRRDFFFLSKKTKALRLKEIEREIEREIKREIENFEGDDGDLNALE